MSDLREPITIEEAFTAGRAAGVKDEKARLVELLDSWIDEDILMARDLAERSDATTSASHRFKLSRRIKEREAAIVLMNGLRKRVDEEAPHHRPPPRDAIEAGQHHNETEGE